jgi:hypothetical protein
VQSAAFRLYLQLLVDMHENTPQALRNIRGRIHDHCWSVPLFKYHDEMANNMFQRSSITTALVKSAKPRPLRQWNNDTDEVYVRKYNLSNGTCIDHSFSKLVTL